jgi:hypothetical protein
MVWILLPDSLFFGNQTPFSMQRREFLGKSGTAVLAATGLPLLLRRDQTGIGTYTGEKVEAGKGKWTFEISLVINSINRFTAAKEADKRISMKAGYINTGTTTAARTVHNTYMLSEVLLLDSSPKKAQMEAKFEKKVAGELVLPTQLPKDLKGVIRPYLDLSMQDTKGKEFVSLRYKTTTTSNDDYDDYDCFLTTACVQHKGLADDCHELEALRFLRENYMRENQLGRQLLADYEVLGPTILNAIHDAHNRPEILEHLYSQLIIPSVQKIEAGHYQEAVDYYAKYVREMEEKYLGV